MNSKKRISLVSLVLLSLTLGSLLSPIRPAAAAGGTTLLVDLVWKNPDCVPGGGSTVPSMSPGSTFTLCLRITDVMGTDVDAWEATISYYTALLTAFDVRYTDACVGMNLPSNPGLNDNVDGVRGQVGIGNTFSVFPEVGLNQACVLAEIDFSVDMPPPGAATDYNGVIHITSFKATNARSLCVASVPLQRTCLSGPAAGMLGHLELVGILDIKVDLGKDAKYAGSSVRYVDLLDSPIRKRCIIENHHYRFDLTRDGLDGRMSFDCTMESVGTSYPVAAKVILEMIDLTTNVQLCDIFSDEKVFNAAGQSVTVTLSKGTLEDCNFDGVRDLQPGHMYLVHAQAFYDSDGDSFEDTLGPKARVFVVTIKA